MIYYLNIFEDNVPNFNLTIDPQRIRVQIDNESKVVIVFH